MSLKSICVLGCTAAILVTAFCWQARAVPIAPQRQWEYKVLRYDELPRIGDKGQAAGDEQIGQQLSKTGEEGWELIVIDYNHPKTFYFKRPREGK